MKKKIGLTTDFSDTRVCRQFFVVPNAGWSKRHGEMIRIDDERRDEWCSSSILSFRNYNDEKRCTKIGEILSCVSSHLFVSRV